MPCPAWPASRFALKWPLHNAAKGIGVHGPEQLRVPSSVGARQAPHRSAVSLDSRDGQGDASGCDCWQAGELRGAHLSPVRVGCRVAVGLVIPASPVRARCGQGDLQELVGGTSRLSKWGQDGGYVLLMSSFKELTEAKLFVKPGRPLWPAGGETF